MPLLVAMAVLARGEGGEGEAGEKREPFCPRAAALSGRCKNLMEVKTDEYYAIVDDEEVWIVVNRNFSLECGGNVSVDNDALPRFSPALPVLAVKLRHCRRPRGSFAQALAALGLTGFGALTVEGAQPDHLPDGPRLDGLSALRRLALSACRRCARPLLSAETLADRLHSLLSLQLIRVTLSADALLVLPRNLTQLHLTDANASSIPAASLSRLADLSFLLVHEEGGVHVDLPPSCNLSSLTLRAPRGLVAVEGRLPQRLQRLEVHWGREGLPGWLPSALKPLCPLKRLELVDFEGKSSSKIALPADLLKDCTQLEWLKLNAPLTQLPASLFSETRELKELHLEKCSLEKLPEPLLNSTSKLKVLNMSGNKLRSLPSRLFLRSGALSELDLSNNRLSAGSMAALAGLASLRRLVLFNNPLGDLCGEPNTFITTDSRSKLSDLTGLTKLDLRNTNITKICIDWRESMVNLEQLDLSHTNIAELTYSDLQFTRNSPSRVNIEDIPLERVMYTREEYEMARRSPSSVTTVTAEAALRCDCGQYWAARALLDHPTHAALSGVRCDVDGVLVDLRRVALDAPGALWCAAPDLCPEIAGCGCRVRPDRGAPGSLALLRCEGANLTRVPPVRGGQSHAWSLLLPNNRIESLDASALPPLLQILDLRNNSISTIDWSIASLLGSESRLANLSGNPFACGCGAYQSLAALAGASAHVEDYGLLRCEGGASLPAPDFWALCRWQAAVAAAALLAAALAVAACAVRRGAFARLSKSALRGRPPPEGALRFDAFVSYAHQDAAAARQLQRRLEGGRRPLRLCLHERDWVPGEWIPAQIAASVRASRRTVALVSAHFAASPWARAEFREALAYWARDGEARLVAVLLDAPAQIPLDAELKEFVADNTYLRWGEPRFWERLERALRSPAPPTLPPDGTVI